MVLSAPFAAGKQNAHAMGKKPGGSETIFAPELVPENASFRLAFVADHHYWPGHYKDWNGKLFRNTDERMRDLVDVLNAEAPDLSIHAGDVIDAGNSFMPPTDEYIKQLDFEREMINGLNHRAIPLIGNHEVPDELYEDESELDQWKTRFGTPHGMLDLNGWRLVWLNVMIPNPGGTYGKKSLYGIDSTQIAWLKTVLDDAARKHLHVLLFAHIPPEGYVNRDEFTSLVTSCDCIRGMITGHNHRNDMQMAGDIPVMVRAANVCSPLAYHMVYPYPDGRIIMVQKSQHFPFLDYISNNFTSGAKDEEKDRYYTIGGSSRLPNEGLVPVGRNTEVKIEDGHLTLRSEQGKGIVLIDYGRLDNARLSFSATKKRATHMGVIAFADDSGEAGIHGVLTSEYGHDGNMYLASYSAGKKEILARSWFNIIDDIAYRFVLEAKNGKITLANKNMPELSAELKGSRPGKFGFFVENGEMYVTDLKLEKLG